METKKSKPLAFQFRFFWRVTWGPDSQPAESLQSQVKEKERRKASVRQ